ncbi:MAG: GH36-type glycosyl hydrolase domain-containing protein [Phycisphaerae bacterium]
MVGAVTASGSAGHHNADIVFDAEQPLRGDLFSVEQLEHHAKALAGFHEVIDRPEADRLLPRLQENERVLLRAYELVTHAAEENRRIAPAAEWLLDNFYLIEEQIRTARRHLPKGFSRELPSLVTGASAGLPRVYDIALELISHVDGRVDRESLTAFVSSYQQATTLKLGELWALPIMLRLSLIENLRRVAARVAAARVDRDRAFDWSRQLIETASANPKNIVLVLADMVRSEPNLSSAFVAEMSRRLQGQGPALQFPMSWIEQRLVEQGVTASQLVGAEGQAQAADQVSIGNSIVSLRFLASVDWRKFVESNSVVEETLRTDPAGVYSKMDFATRDRYRHVVEQIARRSELTELDVAREAIRLSREARFLPTGDTRPAGSQEKPADLDAVRPADAGTDASAPPRREPPRRDPARERTRDDLPPETQHVGFYITGVGRRTLESVCAMRPTANQLAARVFRRAPLSAYLGSVLLLTSAVVLIGVGISMGIAPAWVVLLLTLALIPAGSQFASEIVNWLATIVVRPRTLPRMDFTRGIPPEHQTLVAVPTMLTDAVSVQQLVERLEVHHLANRDDQLRFALVTDFPDADAQELPGDAALLELARRGIESLNRQHGPWFFLFHRARTWNEKQNVWMGLERKRGKLSVLNALLVTGQQEGFDAVVGDLSRLRKTAYVITLDTDTQLPRDAARALVGTMAHPLNRPRIDPETNRIVQGYAILQPRVSTSLPSVGKSRFSRLFAGEPGVDPYTKVVSDVYQDVFGEGSFIGKGIYDVRAFHHTLEGRFPDNRILSHDLIESSYARSGLVSDVELFEDHPSTYLADMSRRHRWVRGDWQIAAWVGPVVPGVDLAATRNVISAISRWKIFDNLRRSIVPTTFVISLLVGWFGGLAWPVTLFVAGLLFLPPVLKSVWQAAHPGDLPLRQHLRYTAAGLGTAFIQQALSVCFMAFEAFVYTDAIVRTFWRLLVSRRNLLEWTTSTDAERKARHDVAGYQMSMWFSLAFSGVVALLLALFEPEALPAATAFLIAWLAAPTIGWWISRPTGRLAEAMTEEDRRYLRNVARRTWRFFEHFIGPADNFLPPDNYQEQPAERVAHRTSPTNIGLCLTSYLAARDFGYVSQATLLNQTERTFETLAKLERFRGHFFNWYDTRTLEPLSPSYISTVDSGNFTGALLTLRVGLQELGQEKVLRTLDLTGLIDVLDVLEDVAREERCAVAGEYRKRIANLRSDLTTPPRTLVGARLVLQRAARLATDLHTAVPAGGQCQQWVSLYERQVRDILDDLVFVAPWCMLSPPPERMWSRGDAEQLERLSELRALLRKLDDVPSLLDVSRIDKEVVPLLNACIDNRDEPATSSEEQGWYSAMRQNLADAARRAQERLARINDLVDDCQDFARADYTFLFDSSRDLLAIGYNVADGRLDASFYDLLASEARLISFVAVAEGQLPQEHWFALGRQLTTTGPDAALLSWSGSMFEYLMPLLFMPNYPGTLLDRTYRGMLRRQIEYGRQRKVPWGISESGYNATDVNLNYQYRAFGVPGLGFKRGLGEELVIAPYASVMGVMVDPAETTANLRRMQQLGFMGHFGFYEAVDYTPGRVQRGNTFEVVQSYMSHHGGMSFLALAYALLGQPMQKRFMANPVFRSVELLLHERVPKVAPVFPHASEVSNAMSRTASGSGQGILRYFDTPNTPAPEVHLLSNGRYHVMISAAGGGYSRWRDLAVTRWREDATRDAWGQFCYLRDVESGLFWSTSHQPTTREAKKYEAVFSQARAEFRRRDHEIETHVEIGVSPEDDVELRRVTLTNRGKTRRVIELTTYAEVVLAAHAADEAHPAFQNLFVQTQLMSNRQAILCTRRPRKSDERPPWMFHMLADHCPAVGEARYETDRSRFIGRGRTLAWPLAMEGEPLTNSEGSVLDPIVSVQRRVTLEPGASAVIDVVTGVADNRDGAISLIEKYRDRRLADRLFELAWTHSQVVLRQLDATEADAQTYGRLASSVIYPSNLRRTNPAVIARNRRGQSGLWGYGISGDLPIVLLRVSDLQKLDLVRQLVQAHSYWDMKGLTCDLVIWNEDFSGYRQDLADQIHAVIAKQGVGHKLDQPGGIFIRRIEQMSEEDKVLLQTVARVIITDQAGTLGEQVERRGRTELAPPKFNAVRPRREVVTAAEVRRQDLLFFNGIGGFTQDGREYIATTSGGQETPAPWCNVLANPDFATIVSESGGGYTWALNAHEYRLSTWYNDPVADTTGEAFYIRDEESGRYFSSSPLPARGAMPYTTRHGFGYTVFEYAENGINSEMWVHVDPVAPVKYVTIKLRNDSGRPRRLSVTGFVEWVLGELRTRNQMHVVTELDAQTGAIFARNAYNVDFAGRVAFFEASEPRRNITGDRTEFIGRNGQLATPAGMMRLKLSGKVGAGLDPCAAIRCPVDLEDGHEKEVTFILGSGRDEQDAMFLVNKYRGAAPARRALEQTWGYWNGMLGTLYVETPDPALNVLANGWLLYQVLASRYWGRSGYYQSGGAYGFRDQLQDVMALLHAQPKLLREHLLRAAAHQFKEGDVQHWWHPPTDRGVRTHFSDDYLWLPLAAARYVAGTGDTGVLDEQIPFLEGRPVKPDEEAYYDKPVVSEDVASLYEHCKRAVINGLKFGEHGLPLIGCGDWNDGMNLIGEKGRGESVWLAFFLFDTLTDFAKTARARGDDAFAQECLDEARKLSENIENNAWDGQWYRRAYFDNGEPLGSASNPECQIDSLPQSWSVLTGAGAEARSRQSMQHVNDRLVRRDAGLIQLFDPPFDKSHLNPGYIKGYVPGVRENGGQYTHAAVWTVMAFAKMGDTERAWELFNLINPVNHARTRQDMMIYKVEPYVVAADVYGVEPHVGRGGWTWYTGSAGWMYRLIIENLLGIHLAVDKLILKPLLPAEWPGFKFTYRWRETHHQIVVHNHGGPDVTRILLDGKDLPGNEVPLSDDRQTHTIEVHLGATATHRPGPGFKSDNSLVAQPPAPKTFAPSKPAE